MEMMCAAFASPTFGGLLPRRAPPPQISTRRPPCAAASQSGKPRRRRRSPKPTKDPILDDGDVDMTSISTFVTCRNCFNSLMVAPEMFLPDGGPIELRCNVCEVRWKGGIDAVETVSGEKFDGNLFLARQKAGVNIGEEEE